MNNERLKSGLRELAEGGWIPTRVTDGLFEHLLRSGFGPSDEAKVRFLSGLHARIERAALRGEFRPSGKPPLKHPVDEL